jgi:hypothetical protein
VSHKLALLSILLLASVAACSDDSSGPNPPPSLNCNQVTPTALSPGEASVSDPTATSPCVAVPSVPAAGSSGAEYLYVAAATAGQQTSSGITGQYAITGASLNNAVADEGPLPSPLLSAFKPPLTAEKFHAMLRQREKQTARDPRTAFRAKVAHPSLATVPPPDSGAQKAFFVCRNANCDSPFVQVTATAQHVGAKVVIFVDNAASATQRYSATDLKNVGRLFDNFLYPIDTTNFGHESDIDGNGVVYVLLSPQINKLSGNCNSTNSVILGYFFSVDLEPGQTGSNNAEIFYSIVPDPVSPICTLSRSFALDNLPPTFIHEFQHMISYGQHALTLNGDAEDTWLNEGLSHYAEELGGRLIPDDQNPTLGRSPNTLTQFAFANYDNAYKYLSNPETTALIESAQSSGTLTERGANWLMVRWLTEQFGTSTEDPSQFIVKGTDFTLKLEATTRVGADNVAQQSGQSFSDLDTYWNLANYLDHLPGFTPADPRLGYLGLNLRSKFAQLNQQDPDTYSRPYPLAPDSTTTGTYQRAGTLKQGSGHHVRIKQAPGAAAVQFRLAGTNGAAISSDLVPRIGLVRIH